MRGLRASLAVATGECARPALRVATTSLLHSSGVPLAKACSHPRVPGRRFESVLPRPERRIRAPRRSTHQWSGRRDSNPRPLETHLYPLLPRLSGDVFGPRLIGVLHDPRMTWGRGGRSTRTRLGHAALEGAKPPEPGLDDAEYHQVNDHAGIPKPDASQVTAA
jgi:hypothetical protein